MSGAAQTYAVSTGQSSPNGRPAKKQKPRILRWRGVLDTMVSAVRGLVALALVVGSIALCFTQLGFVGLSFANGETAYVVTLLQLVALGALLLGTFAGAAIGLAAGSVLLLHSWYLPLDHFELAYVTPLTSVVMLGGMGLLLGCLFAFALRNNPTGIRRAIYLILVCVVVSWLYSIGFIVNVVLTLAVSLSETMSQEIEESVLNGMVLQTAMRLGSLDAQAWLDALLMAALCIVGDLAARAVQERKGSVGLRTVFGGWLSVVVLLAFLLMSAASFASATANELREAETKMRDEVSYLCTQLSAASERAAFLGTIADDAEVDLEHMDQQTIDRYAKAYSDEVLIEGYGVEDGLILVGIGDSIYLSNVSLSANRAPEGWEVLNEAAPAGEADDKPEDQAAALTFEEVFGTDFVKAIKAGLKNDTLQRFIYDFDYSRQSDNQQDATTGLNPRIAYAYAKNVDVSLGGSDSAQATYTVIIVYDSDQVFALRTSFMVSSTVSAFVLMLAVFGIVFLLLNRVVARRIDEENTTLSRITAGELDVRAEAGGTSEFESLSNGINTTVDALKGWIREAETRMDAELETARAIQESALPQVFPPYPDILRFDVYAIMHAAKHVGGDFYDFFLIGDASPEEGKLAFVMADVSGKGVPAALFMMKAKAQLRGYLESGMGLGEAVENANRQLCDGNDAGMFVTAWIGVLDYGTRSIEYVNAGHNPPLFWSRSAAEGSADAAIEGEQAPADPEHAGGGWRWLTERSGMPLGLFDGIPYTSYSLKCQIGDQILLYTDGVTEAMDAQGGLYGEDRLMGLAEQHYPLHPRPLVETLRASVGDFAQGAEQSDDITILALEVGVPPEVTKTLVVPADVSELPRVNAFVHEELDRRLCPEHAQHQLDIAVEELFVNVAHYAYPDATPENPGMVRIGCTYSSDPSSIRVDIADEGVPYNPLAKPDAVTPDDIAAVPIGGLGILMAKKSVDQMTYERIDSSNVVSVLKCW